MAKNGVIALQNLKVKRVVHDKGTSSLVASVGTVTVTIETTAGFPDDFNPRVDGLVDLKLEYDPK